MLEIFPFQGEGTFGIEDTRPIKLREVLGFSRIGGIGERKCIARSSVKGLLEMDDIQSLFLFCTPAEVFAYFPIKSGLQCVFDTQCSPFNEENVFHEVRGGMAGEGIQKTCHLP